MNTYNFGTFIVNSDGEFNIDYLFDGGGFRGELAVFSIEEMEDLTPGSTEFILEAARRALTDSQGHILIRDEIEGARFSADLPWEQNHNTDSEKYQGIKTFSMTPGEEVGLMLVQNASVQEIYDNPDDIYTPGKTPIFSIPEANRFNSSQNQAEFVDVYENGTIALEDVPGLANKDYNDLIYQIQGLEGDLPKIEDYIDLDHDWRTIPIGEQLLNYTDTRTANEEDTDNSLNSLMSEGDVVYRFDRIDSQTQFYTTSEEERDYIQATLSNYEYEGESFISAFEGKDNDISEILPVYRFFNVDTGDHFYTASNTELDYVDENLSNYIFEGIAYYGYESQQIGMVPMYRFYNENLNAHFYTSSVEERDKFLTSPNYQPEGNEDGIAFYVQPIEI